jgi:hypothetical protein
MEQAVKLRWAPRSCARLRRRSDLPAGRVPRVGLVVVLVCALVIPDASAVVDTAAIAADADWIMSARLPDGAIANYVDRQAVWPYLSNFAAMGLARAATVTKKTAYSDAAWSWLSWYQAHENAQGFVTDYTASSGVLTSTNDMDSTDSYAGTFLLAVREAYRATNDGSRLRGLATGIAGAVKAIEATQDADGLTWAKPTWHVKYLMDQGETYAGLLAAVDLANALGNSSLARQAGSDASRMKTGVANLWNTTTSAYDWAIHDGGGRTATSWSVLYSDSLQQAWAVAFGLVDATRAQSLVTKFNTSQPNWHSPQATALFSGGTASVGYWPVAGYGFSAISSPLAATAPLDIRSAALATNRAWPFTTGNAGQLILFQLGYTLPLAAAAPAPAPTPIGGKTGSTLATSKRITTTTNAAPARTTLSTTATVAPTTTAPKPVPTTTTTLVGTSATVGPVTVQGGVGAPTPK